MSFKPNTTIQDWIKADASVGEKIVTVKNMLNASSYNGKYKELFASLAIEIFDVFATIRREVSDGFQFRDLEVILTQAGPDLYQVFKAISSLGKEKEREEIFRDLIMFIYFELEKLLKMGGFFKFILRTVVRVYGAKKLAKYTIIAFDYIDGKITAVTNKASTFVSELINKF